MKYPFYALLGLYALTYVPFLGGLLISLFRSLIDRLDDLDADGYLLALSGFLLSLIGGMLVCAFVGAWWTFGCFVVTFLILLRVYSKEP